MRQLSACFRVLKCLMFFQDYVVHLMFEHHKKIHTKSKQHTCYAMAAKLNKMSIKNNYLQQRLKLSSTVNQRQEIAFPDVFVPVISSKWRFEVKSIFKFRVNTLKYSMKLTWFYVTEHKTFSFLINPQWFIFK